MRSVYSLIMFLFLALMVMSTEAGKVKKENGKRPKATSECTEWKEGACVAKNGNCGPGMREDTCNDKVKKHKCKVPCNGKALCKYRYGSWGECDAITRTKTRTGTLKKSMKNAQCEPTSTMTKQCRPKTKSKTNTNGKKGKGKEN